jgi:hypothetical protein
MTSNFPSSNYRMFMGVIAGSLVPVICFAAFFAVSGWRSSGDASLALLPMLVGTPIAILAAAVLAPIVWCWNRAGRLSLRRAVGLGGIASALPMGLWTCANLIQGWYLGVLRLHDAMLMALWVLIFFALGVLGACVGWLIAFGPFQDSKRSSDA